MSFVLGFEHKGKQSRMDCTENDRDSKKLYEVTRRYYDSFII